MKITNLSEGALIMPDGRMLEAGATGSGFENSMLEHAVVAAWAETGAIAVANDGEAAPAIADEGEAAPAVSDNQKPRK